MAAPVLAVDIGGTKVAVALVSPEGEVLCEAVRPTLAIVDGVPRAAEEVYAGLTDAVAEVLTGVRELTGLGIGSAGPLELGDGTISPLNIPSWRRFPIVERLREDAARAGHPGVRPVLIGDGHCVALGEAWRGAGRGAGDIIGVICSTGVGAGVVLGGRPFQGRTGNAVHVGHVVVDVDGRPCACGSRGCVEALASGTSMVAIARERGWRGGDAKDLTDDARAGDPVATQVVDEGMRALAAGLAGMVTLFDIPTVVVGGGVAKAGDVVFAPLRRHFAAQCRLAYVADVAEIRQATLPNAGLLGAAKAALDAARGE